MISLNDYLYSGYTILQILHKYTADLRESAKQNHNELDLLHCNFLLQFTEILEHNDFLNSQSQRIREFYKYMAKEYPYLAFTFKGRIKALIRAEEKFNGYIVETVYDLYQKNGVFPTVSELRENLMKIRDLIAYRIVIQLPKYYLKEGDNAAQIEKDLLYEIAEKLPVFLEERDFNAELAYTPELESSRLSFDVKPYYRDYVEHPNPFGYQSLHVTFYDVQARCCCEVQLRTKDMDDAAEIGVANHLAYEKRQQNARKRDNEIPSGQCRYFDEACERVEKLRTLELKDVDVNMFSAADNVRTNDGCGLLKGRLILPYEHLSSMQKDASD